MLFTPVAASGRHLFLDAAVFQEILLVFFQQPPQQEISLMNQHQRNVGKRDIIAQLADADIIGWRRMLLAPLPGIHALLATNIPFLVAMIAKIVLVILLQFLEACLCHIHQFDASLHRSCARLVALSDVLLARASSLHHLVNSAVANLRQIMLHEIECDVVDALRLLEGDKVLVIALGSKEFVIV